MEKTTLRLQTILYYNEKENLEKSLASVARAVEVSRKKGGCIERIDICYGDASAEPIYTDAEIAALNQKYGEFFRLFRKCGLCKLYCVQIAFTFPYLNYSFSFVKALLV